MLESELKEIENRLDIKLPSYYVETMLDYPFEVDSFAHEFTLCADHERIIDYNGIFRKSDTSFAIGSDGGEYFFFVQLNGQSKVYIFDLEGSDFHMSVKANSWVEYLNILNKDEEVIAADIKKEKRNRMKKKWWQFWKN